MTQKKIAQRLNLDPKTIRNWKETRPELLKILYLGLEAEEKNMKQSVIIGGNINNVDMSSHKRNINSQETNISNNNGVETYIEELDELMENNELIIEIVKILKQLPVIKQRKIRLQVELELISEVENATR